MVDFKVKVVIHVLDNDRRLQGINPVRGFVESVEDIGWMNRWFYLELAMRDYDVPDE
jgi:hypothetical protein